MVQMRAQVCAFLGVALGATLVVSGVSIARAGAPRPNRSLVADWEMNEPAGSRVMVDRTGHGHNGRINRHAARDGLRLNGRMYQWSIRPPADPPVQLPRVVQVPDSAKLDIPHPGWVQTIMFRFKTEKPYGNIMQKGQATDPGGQIKIENPGGYTQCVYHGANHSYVAVPSPKRLDDNRWHVFACVHKRREIQVWVDGAEVAHKRFTTGPINNAYPFLIGGKSRCDQVKVTCDYYSGAVDWVRIYRYRGR